MYSMLMLTARKVFLGIASAALIFFLYVLALDASVVRVAGSPTPIKNLLATSGIYKSIVPSSLDQAKNISSGDNQIPLTDPAVRAAAESTFNPQYLQSTSDNVIDSIYRWLDGKTPLPDFKVDLAAKKVEFANKVADAVEQRTAALPKCAAPVADFDPISGTCLPASITPQQAANQVKQEILTGDFIDPAITANTVKSEGSNQSIFADQLKQAPKAYQKFKSSPFVLALLTILALAGVILLSNPWQRGLKHAGFLLLFVGIFLVLFGLAVNSATNNKVLSKINLTNKVLQTDVRKLVHDGVYKLDNTFVLFGIGYAILGALGVGGYYYMHRSNPAGKPAEAKVETTEQTKPETPQAKPKPAPRKKIKVN